MKATAQQLRYEGFEQPRLSRERNSELLDLGNILVCENCGHEGLFVQPWVRQCSHHVERLEIARCPECRHRQEI